MKRKKEKDAVRRAIMKSYWWKIALQSFSGAIFMALSLFILIAASIHYGFTNLLGLTTLASGALACCKTPFSWCLVSPTMFMTVIPWVGFGIVTIGLVVAMAKAGRNLWISRKFTDGLRQIPAGHFPGLKKLADTSKTVIIVFEDTRLKSAFALGLVRPKVYISTELISKLTHKELIAVTLHEIHHVEKKDPLKLFILSVIKDLFFFLPLGHYLSDTFYRTKELAADERAAKLTGQPVDLAQALLKMVRMKREFTPVGVPMLENPSLVAERIKELIEPGKEKRSDRPYKFVLVTTAAALFAMVLALTAPIYAGANQMEKCNQNYCLTPPERTTVKKCAM